MSCVVLLLGLAPPASLAHGKSCILEPPSARPLLQLGAWQEQLDSPDGHFVIHWNSSGDSASTGATAQAVLEGLLAAARVYHDSLGYARPPAAEGTAVPVFLQPQPAMGATQPQNPVGNGYSSSLFLDRSFARWGADSLGLASLTAAHEYFHAVQFGSGFFVSNLAFYEASAVWAEDRVYPAQDDWVTRYAPSFLADLSLPLDTFSGVRHYGAAAALKILLASQDGPEDLRLTLQLAGQHHAWPFLLSLRSDANTALAHMLAELLHAGSRVSQGAGVPSFPELGALPEVDRQQFPMQYDGAGLAPLASLILRPGTPSSVLQTALPVYALDWPSWTPAVVAADQCLPLGADDLLLMPNPAPLSWLELIQLGACTLPEPGFSVSSLGNPSRIRITVEEGPLALGLYTILGTRIPDWSLHLDRGVFDIPVPGLASGSYLLIALPHGPARRVLVVK